MAKIRHVWLMLSVVVRVSGCSARPENPPSGSCSLSCGTTRVSGAEFTITPVLKEYSIACTEAYGDKTTVPLQTPVVVRFKVTQAVPTTFTPAAAGGGTGTTTSSVIPIRELPVANVGFDPVVYGSMALAKTATELVNENGEVKRARYGGIVTPPSEWCSDSCGMMTYEFWPNCVSGVDQAVIASVAAGGVVAPTDSAAGPPVTKVTITNIK